jgi:acetyltransferase-like isoleucine patch superfamily enzyme
MRAAAQVLLWVLPWFIRRPLLCLLFGFRIDPAARIGFSVLAVGRLEMAGGARIGHLTYAKGLDRIVMGRNALLGPLNWITAYPSRGREFFTHVIGRDPSLLIAEEAAITGRHLIDCTACVSVGSHAIVAGWGSQIVSHSIDFETSRQDAQPIGIGSYSFVGSRCVLLKGSSVPDRSIVTAGSTYGLREEEPLGLFAGVPARRARELDPGWAYFNRALGYVR